MEAELQLLTEEEADKLPAGKGRESPEGLPEPKYVVTGKCLRFSWQSISCYFTVLY